MPARPRPQPLRQVGAGGEQDRGDRGEQEQEALPRLTNNRLVERHDHAGQRDWLVCLFRADVADLQRQNIELRARLFRRDAGTQAANRLVVALSRPAEPLGVHVDRDECFGDRRRPRRRQLKAGP
jgi:hypothetical protein